MGKDVWPLLLEKSFAKVAGSYGSLEAGITEVAFQMLTGQTHQILWRRADDGRWAMFRFDRAEWRGQHIVGGRATKTGRDLASSDLFARLAYYDQANFMIAANIAAKSRWLEFRRADGLVEGHAYSILEVQEIHGVKLVRLRNPWGQVEWKGPWSRGSPEWRRRPDVALDASRGDDRADGSFWMAFEDFTATFDNINVCPATMPVPKSSRLSWTMASSGAAQAVYCGRCGCRIQSLWTLCVSSDATGSSRVPVWQRLRSGDLCALCLRATARRRRQWRDGVEDGEGRTGPTPKDICGVNATELMREVPGVDYLPFEAGSSGILPGYRPVCPHGEACVQHDAAHHAEMDHPWLRSTPDMLRKGKGARRAEKSRFSFFN